MPESNNDNDLNKKPHDPLYKRIRILRKKLKQIETLKLLPRKLNAEETIKIQRQDDFRVELLDLLAQQHEQNKKLEAESSMSADLDDESGDGDVQGGNTPRSNDTPSDTQSSHVTDRPGKEVSPPKEPVVLTSKSKSKTEPASIPTATRADPLQSVRKTWANKYFELLELSGHTDIVLCVDINAKYIVSGSRDTTVKLWDAVTGELLHNFGGHTGFVSCVKLLETKGNTTARLVSGSDDCTIRFWDIETGKQIKEFYVYNSVLCMSIMADGEYVVAGLDGGKLEVYNVDTVVTPFLSHSLQTEAITCMSCVDKTFAVGGTDGLVAVLELCDRSVRCLYSLNENITDGVKSIVLRGNDVIIGDDAANIKVLRWKTGSVSTLANHHSEFGVTDALCTHGSYLLSAAYNYDSGVGYINVRDVSGEKYSYISSVVDSDVPHILCMAVTSSDIDSLMSIVAGGIILVLYREDPKRSVESVKCSTKRLLLAEDQLTSDSDLDEDLDVTDSDDSIEQEEQAPSSGWWCSIL